MIEAEDDSGVLQELGVLDKQVSAVMAVCTKLALVGRTSPEALQCYRSQVHYLSCEPKAPSPFPPYLVKMMHSQSVEDAWPAQSFWAKLVDHALLELIDEEDVPELQIEALTSKVMLIAQEGSFEDVEGGARRACG